MKAAVFAEPGRIVLDEKPIPEVGPLHVVDFREVDASPRFGA